MPYNYQPKHLEQRAQHLNRVLIRTDRRSDADLTVSPVLPSHARFPSPTLSRTTTGGVSVECQIHVPRESRLAIQHGTGHVFVNNVIGDIQARCGPGDILLMLPDAGAYS